MYRHVFIGVIKENVGEKKISERIEALKLLKEKVPVVTGLAVGRNLGWYGKEDAIVLVGDFRSKDDWTAFVASEYHQQLNAVAAEVFDMEKLKAYQFEVEE